MSGLSNNEELRQSSKKDDAKSEQHDNEADASESEPFLVDSEYAMKILFLRIHPDSNSSIRLPRYASVRHLGPWIPETDPTHPRANTLSVRLAQRRTMLIIQAITASVFAAVAVGLMSWFTAKHAPVGDVGTFMLGSCSTVNRWNAFWHVFLNVTSTLVLGAGNYCMQVLVAPSRAEVDKAHRQGYSLDVGIHSFANVWKISPKRRGIWFVLGVISTLMHLL